MPAISRKVGNTSEKLQVFVPDATVSTGAGLANVVASSVSFGWHRDDMSAVSSGTCTTGTLGTYGVSSFVQMSSTNMLGWYEFCPPDGVFSLGRAVALHLYGAPSMAPVPYLIDLSTQVAAVTAPVGVTTLSVPVGVSSASVNLGVSTLAVPVGVSSASVNIGVSTVTATVLSDVRKINNVTIVGDGSATPFNV